MSNRLNKDSLNEVFNVDEENNNEQEQEQVIDVTPENNGTTGTEENTENDGNREQEIEDELRETLSTAKDILSNAKEIIHAAPDADTLASAGELINSVTGIIKELNRSIMMDKKHSQSKELENLKAKNKKEIAELKQKQLQLGNGNQVYLQQNYYDNKNEQGIPFCQENIVKKLNEEEKNNKENQAES